MLGAQRRQRPGRPCLRRGAAPHALPGLAAILAAAPGAGRAALGRGRYVGRGPGARAAQGGLTGEGGCAGALVFVFGGGAAAVAVGRASAAAAGSPPGGSRLSPAPYTAVGRCGW